MISCISYYSYIKPQQTPRRLQTLSCCISYYSYIKPQPNYESARIKSVVYRTIPTSNHNTCILCVCARMLYIVLFLHQTTTGSLRITSSRRCISYYSYIKPQHDIYGTESLFGCISYYSYIKPQLACSSFIRSWSCISYYSYIKPQRRESLPKFNDCCISYYSYIKPQHYHGCLWTDSVVYRTIPTSNHNL